MSDLKFLCDYCDKSTPAHEAKIAVYDDGSHMTVCKACVPEIMEEAGVAGEDKPVEFVTLVTSSF